MIVSMCLRAQNGELVAQFKATVLLMPNGSDRVTSAPLQALASEKKIESEELRKLLASSVKSKVRFPHADDVLELLPRASCQGGLLSLHPRMARPSRMLRMLHGLWRLQCVTTVICTDPGTGPSCRHPRSRGQDSRGVFCSRAACKPYLA